MSHKSEGSVVERAGDAGARPVDTVSELEAGHAGVKTVEATQRVWDDFGRWARWTLFGRYDLVLLLWTLLN